jgi:hypothetical protein
MPADLTQLEARVATLESALYAIQRRFGMNATAPNWLERVAGSMSDIPEDVWQEFQEACREVKNEGRPSEEVEESTSARIEETSHV